MKIIKRVLALAALSLMCGTVASAAEGWNVGDISVINQNNAEGTFQIQISDVVGLDNITEIKAAVWSEEDGQDDLRWYQPVVDGAGNGVIDVAIRDHNYDLGKYNVHVYVWDQNGNAAAAGGAWCYFNPEKANPTVTSIQEDADYQVDLAGVELPAGAGEIRYAVWSSVNGQDDLIWYTAKRQDDGMYSAHISIDSHKGFGQYEVHAYAFSESGQAYFLGADVFLTNEPAIGTIEVLNNRIQKESFSVKLDQVRNTGLIRDIQVGVWSEENGQDDLVFYPARKLSDGTYIATVNVKNHNYSIGTYFAHIYITDRTGYQYFAGSADKTVQVKQGEISVDEQGQNCEVTLEGSEAPGGAKNVSFAVWSDKDGQNDLQWYDSKLENGAYVADVSLRKLKSLGDYNVHAYITMQNEKMVFAGGDVFTTAEPRVKKTVVDLADREKGKFRIRLSEIEHAELLREIKVPVWSREDQSDIVWYTAKPDGNGNYIVDVDIKEHQYNSGIYTAHVYVTDISGNTFCTGGTECDMAILYSSLQVEDLDGTETSFRAELKGVKVPAGAKSLQFAVWGDEGGQNDLTWYTAKLQGDGTYTADIKIKNHKETGTYYVDAYAVSKGDTHQWIASRTFTIDQGVQAAGITVSELNGTKGTFKITVSGLIASSGIEQVKLDVWTGESKENLMQYTAVKESEGVYTVIVNVENHGYQFGEYYADAYVTAGNGILTHVGSTSATFNPENYMYYVSIDDYQTKVIVLGVSEEAGEVRLPTWSESNGQDDLVWYEGVRQEDGSYSVMVDSSRHKHAGDYITHLYIDGTAYGNGITYHLEREGAGIPASIIEQIKYYVGVPYVLSGSTPTGWDCSGFTYWVYQNFFDITIGRMTYDQVKEGVAVDPFDMDAWLPGDLIFYSPGGNTLGHVALYLGDGLIMHALNPARGTFIQSAEEYARWDGLPVAVRRILD